MARLTSNPILRRIVGDIDIGASDAEVAERVRSRLQKGAPARRVNAIVRAAVTIHHENQKLARDVSLGFVNPRRRRNARKPRPSGAARRTATRVDIGGPRARFVRYTQRAPSDFHPASLRTITLGKKGVRGARGRQPPQGVKAVVGCPHRDPKGRIAHTWDAKSGRCRVGTRIQSVLYPRTAGEIRTAVARKHALRARPSVAAVANTPRSEQRNTRRVNPGTLMVLNPLPPALRSVYSRLHNAAERAEFIEAVKRYKTFHGSWPTRITPVKRVDGRNKFVVGVGSAVEVGYKVPTDFRGSNKHGTPFRHEFRARPLMVVNAKGNETTILNRPDARRGYRVTDWYRG